MPIIQSLPRNVSFISNSYVVHVDQYTRSYETESNKIILNDTGTAAVRCPWNEKNTSLKVVEMALGFIPNESAPKNCGSLMEHETVFQTPSGYETSLKKM